MGYSTRNNGQIRTYWPDDTDNKLYISTENSVTLEDIIYRAKQKWGKDISFKDLFISSEHIHTDCLGYDLYDFMDWTTFITITKQKG